MQEETVVTLPGGALIGEALVRDAAFRPFTGRLEELLAELLDAQGASRPGRVSAMLAAVLANVGGRPATPALVAALGVTDRQMLMLAFAQAHSADQQWRHVVCAHCSARFDIGFSLSSLPVSPAGDGYPWTAVTVAGKCLCLRVPTGEDEERIADLPTQEARRALALACVDAIDSAPPAQAELDAIDEAGVDAIDAALDALAPQIATTLSAVCSECAGPNTLELDPYEIAMPDRRQVYREVHALALRYHWSEDAILELTRARRRLYLDLIDESAGHAH